MWKNVTIDFPCLICGKADWCSFLSGEDIYLCRRIKSNNEKIDKNGAYYWIHNLQKDKKVKKFYYIDRRRRSDDKHNMIAIDKIYHDLIHRLSISDKHRMYLYEERKISNENIINRQYKTIDRNIGQHIEYLVDIYGDEVLKVPGFYIDNNSIKFNAIYGILIPVRNVHGNITALLVSPDNKNYPKYLYISSRKYNGLPPFISCHIPLFHTNDSHAIIVEGIFKSDIVAEIKNNIIIGIPTISTISNLFECLDYIHPKKITLALDSDWVKNDKVGSHYSDVVIKIKYWIKSRTQGRKYD